MDLMAEKLLYLSDNMTEQTDKKQAPKKLKQKRCVVYWIEDRQVSTEPLSSVVDQENAKEGCICKIKWKGKGPYNAKIITISDDKDTLKSSQLALEEDLNTLIGDNAASPDDSNVSSKGRKRKKSAKVIAAAADEESAESDKDDRQPHKAARAPQKKQAHPKKQIGKTLQTAKGRENLTMLAGFASVMSETPIISDSQTAPSVDSSAVSTSAPSHSHLDSYSKAIPSNQANSNSPVTPSRSLDSTLLTTSSNHTAAIPSTIQSNNSTATLSNPGISDTTASSHFPASPSNYCSYNSPAIPSSHGNSNSPATPSGNLNSNLLPAAPSNFNSPGNQSNPCSSNSPIAPSDHLSCSSPVAHSVQLSYNSPNAPYNPRHCNLPNTPLYSSLPANMLNHGGSYAATSQSNYLDANITVTPSRHHSSTSSTIHSNELDANFTVPPSTSLSGTTYNPHLTSLPATPSSQPQASSYPRLNNQHSTFGSFDTDHQSDTVVQVPFSNDIISEFAEENRTYSNLTSAAQNVEIIASLKEEVQMLKGENAALHAELATFKGSEVRYHLQRLLSILNTKEMASTNPTSSNQLYATTSSSASSTEDSDDDIQDVYVQAMDQVDETNSPGSMIQLIKDPSHPERFQSVQVHAMSLYSLQQKALKKDINDAPAFLLNGIIDLLFDTATLSKSCGLGLRGNTKADRSPLCRSKVAAIREYLRTMTTKHGWTELSSQEFNKKFTYKCTNARRSVAKST